MLVSYSDSSSESDLEKKSTINPARKRKAEAELVEPSPKKLPPLPSTFHSLYTTAARTSTIDDPALHAGRIRQVPHVVGNWPAHVYLEWYPSPTDVVILEDIIEQVSADTSSDGTTPHKETLIHTFWRSDLGALLPLHVSLSAPLVLRTEQKTLFEESLAAQLKQLRVSAFTISVVGIDWVSNHDETRFFLVLRLSKPAGDELSKLLDTCNSSAQELGLTQLYAAPEKAHIPANRGTVLKNPDNSRAFHISIGWTLQRPTEDAACQISSIVVDRSRSFEIRFDTLKLKMGNIVLDILLDQYDGGHGSPKSVGVGSEDVLTEW